MSWQEKVKNLMNDRGINQKQLSQLSGITESSVSRYLRSDRRPRLDVWLILLKRLALQLTIYLMMGKRVKQVHIKQFPRLLPGKVGS